MWLHCVCLGYISGTLTLVTSSLELPVWLTTYVRDHSTWHNEHVVGAACAPVAFHLFTDG